MAKQQLLDYIKQCSGLNFSPEQIRGELAKVGWSSEDVNEAFSVFNSITVKTERKESVGVEVNGSKTDLKSDHQVEPKVVEPKVEVKAVEPKVEAKAAESKVEPEINTKIDTKVSAKVEQKLEPAANLRFEAIIGADSGAKKMVKQDVVDDTKISNVGVVKKVWRLPVIKFNKTSFVSIIIFFLLLLGAGALAYFYYFPTPDKVLTKMMSNLGSIKSLSYTSEVKFDFKVNKSLENNPFYLQLAAINKSTEQSKTSDPSDISFDNQSHYLTLNLNGQTDLGSSLKSSLVLKFSTDEIANGASLGMEARSLGNLAYVSLDLPNLGFLDFSSLKNQWIKFNVGSGANSLNSYNNSSTSASSTSNLAQNNFQLVLAQSDRLKALLVESSVFSLTEVFPNEKINNLEAYHYGFTVDKTGLQEFITKADKILFNASLSESQGADLKNNLNKVEAITGDIWIGKDDYLPYKLVLRVTMKESNDDLVKIKNITITLSGQDFNQPLDIKEPVNARTAEEAARDFLMPMLKVMGDKMGGSTSATSTESATSTDILADTGSGNLISSSSPTSSPHVGSTTPLIDSGLDSDHDGLTDYQEINIYKTNPFNKDTDGDGYTDGEEVKNGYNPNGPGKLPGKLK